MGSTEIFRFLAIYKYLRASTRLIDAFSAGDHQVFSKPLPFDFDLCHRHVTRPTTKAAVTAAATAATASPLALPSSTPFPLETHARKYVHFVSFFSSILLFNLIHSRNVCTFVRPFLSFLFFFFFFVILFTPERHVPWYVRFVSCFFSFFFFFSIVFTPEMHVQHYVHFGSRFFFYFFLFFFFIKNFPKCMYFRHALLTFETTHVWHMMMLTI